MDARTTQHAGSGDQDRSITPTLKYHIQPRKNPLCFSTNFKHLFFDETNRELILVDSGLITRVPLDRTKQPSCFRINTQGIKAAKWSPDSRWLTLLRSDTTIEIVSSQFGSVIHTQSCQGSRKAPNKILGFYWANDINIFFVTLQGVEVYSFSPNIRLIKHYKVAVKWFVYSAELRILLLATGATENMMHCLHFTLRRDTVIELPNFVVDTEPDTVLKPSEIVITQLYSRVYCIHVNNARRELVLYQLAKEGVIKRLSIHLHAQGTVFLHTIDNLLITHHIEQKVSMLFDIRARNPEDNTIPFPLAAPLPLAPFTLPANYHSVHSNLITNFLEKSKNKDTAKVATSDKFVSTPYSPHASNDKQISSNVLTKPKSSIAFKSSNNNKSDIHNLNNGNSQKVRIAEANVESKNSKVASQSQRKNDDAVVTYELYNDWEFYLPALILDKKNGLLWELEINLQSICASIGNRIKLVAFLLRRVNTKRLLLQVMQEAIEEREDLQILSSIFDRFNSILASYLEENRSQKQSQSQQQLSMNVVKNAHLMGDLSSSATSVGSVNATLQTDDSSSKRTSDTTSEGSEIATIHAVSFWHKFVNNQRSERPKIDMNSMSRVPLPPNIMTLSLPTNKVISRLKDESTNANNLQNAISNHATDLKEDIHLHREFSTSSLLTLSESTITSKATDSTLTNTLKPSTSYLSALMPISARTRDGYLVIDQEDMYTNVFVLIEEKNNVEFKYLVAVLIEYIRSLNFAHIRVHSYLYELLIHLLVRNNRYYQLHQFLQYHVIADSFHVACQLLSLESTYPPAYQLALDMLKRLRSYDEILEVFLTKGNLFQALRFLRNHFKDLQLSQALVTRFLEEAHTTNDEQFYYTVFKFFESHGLIDYRFHQKYITFYNDLIARSKQQKD
jgi:hypothetical protein